MDPLPDIAIHHVLKPGDIGSLRRPHSVRSLRNSTVEHTLQRMSRDHSVLFCSFEIVHASVFTFSLKFALMLPTGNTAKDLWS
jgi:hypothetical protein